MEPIIDAIFRDMKQGDRSEADKRLGDYGEYMKKQGIEEERARIKNIIRSHLRDTLPSDGHDPTTHEQSVAIEYVVNVILAHIDREPQPETGG